MLRVIISFLAVLACVSGISAKVTYAGTCKLKSENILYLKGSTDEKMLACVEKNMNAPIKTVIVKSQGGKVETALQIGDILAGFDAHMIVEKECNSSCANYFLPVARNVSLKKAAMIILHGSIDAGFVKERLGSDKIEYWQALANKQDAYAKKHNIPRGWLFYRQSYDGGVEEYRPYIEGEMGWPEDYERVKAKMGGRLVVKLNLVDQPLVASCLPHVRFGSFEKAAIGMANTDQRYREKLIKRGVLSTGEWRCVEIDKPQP